VFSSLIEGRAALTEKEAANADNKTTVENFIMTVSSLF
jgi:hypothetical protein